MNMQDRIVMSGLLWIGTSTVLGCGSDSGRANDDVGSGVLLDGGAGEEDGSHGGDGGVLDLGSPGEPVPPSGDEDCEAEIQEAEVEYVPIDVVLVVDTSGSMGDAVAAVEDSINSDFAEILGASGIDYRVIVLGNYDPDVGMVICIAAPLSGTDCVSPPPVPAVTSHYQHYDAETGSEAMLDNIIEWYSEPDPHGLAPGGYQDLLREDSEKVFLVMTDGYSATDDPQPGNDFDQDLLSLTPAHFGTVDDRRYVFHSIITMPVNRPSTEPWLPDDPIEGEGGSIQQVSVLSGGWRFPLSEVEDFDVVFQQIAQGVIETTPIECEFPIPTTPEGEEIDPDTIEIDYLPGGVMPAESFHQVVGPDECSDDAFYITDDEVVLCPQACGVVQADTLAVLSVRYGCDVGFEPAG